MWKICFCSLLFSSSPPSKKLFHLSHTASYASPLSQKKKTGREEKAQKGLSSRAANFFGAPKANLMVAKARNKHFENKQAVVKCARFLHFFWGGGGYKNMPAGNTGKRKRGHNLYKTFFFPLSCAVTAAGKERGGGGEIKMTLQKKKTWGEAIAEMLPRWDGC